MAKCLVLGANGFIGSHLVDTLAQAGHTVKAFDRFSSGQLFNDHSNVEIFKGDFLNRSDLSEAVKGTEYVFHFISTTTPITAENDPLVDVDTNIKMSIELFQDCAENRVKRLIFASTGGAIYGMSGSVAHKEDDLPQPVSPYAIGKLTIEHYLRYFRIKHGLDSVALRISNPYGERQALRRKQGVIPIFIENVCQDLPLTVLGDGSMVRDYIYVKDVASMVSGMFENPLEFDTYNIGSGIGVSVSQLVEAVAEVSGKHPVIEHKEVPATFVHKVVLDTARFNNEFNIKPLVELKRGLQATLAYVQAGLGKEKYV